MAVEAKKKRELSPILVKVLKRRDEMGVTNYWIAKRAKDSGKASIPAVYNFLENRADPNQRILVSVLGLVGLEVSDIDGFEPVE